MNTESNIQNTAPESNHQPLAAPEHSGAGLVAPKLDEGGFPTLPQCTNPSIHSSSPAVAEPKIEIQNSKFKNADGPSDDSYTRELLHSHTGLPMDDPTPWPAPVIGKTLLDNLAALLGCFVVLPKWAAETLALWILHTYLFKSRDVTTYLGIESPEKRCGKTTLLTVLSELVNRPVVSTNISSPAFFRVIEEVQPTLLIDEADTFLHGNHELRGILNSGYHRKTAFVVRVTHEPRNNSESRIQNAESSIHQSTPPSTKWSPSLGHLPGGGLGKPNPSIQSSGHPPIQSRLIRFSCWCPKAIAAIGRFPDTLADRCIVIRMQRKTPHEQCERLRNLETKSLRQQCARFALDHSQAVASARAEIPPSLNDRAADIWEPLVVLADLAGGDWPQLARQAAVALTATAQDSNPIASLLLDIFLVYIVSSAQRMFSRTLVEGLSARSAVRPWAEARKGKDITELWLAQQLRPYGIRPRTLWIGEDQAKGYFLDDFRETFQRYIPKTEAKAFLAEFKSPGDKPGDPSHPPTTVEPPARDSKR